MPTKIVPIIGNFLGTVYQISNQIFLHVASEMTGRQKILLVIQVIFTALADSPPESALLSKVAFASKSSQLFLQFLFIQQIGLHNLYYCY